MQTVDVKSQYEKRLIKIWEEIPDYISNAFPFIRRGFAIQNHLKKDSILFIGLNPSIDEKTVQTENIFYDDEHMQTHKYFSKFIQISDYLGMNWTHLDLLFFRETKQSKIKELCDKTKKLNNSDYKKTILSQIEIALEIISQANPKIIVVNNTKSRDLLMELSQNYSDFKISWDETIGTYRLSLNNVLSNVPIFFSSMLTGQRALDNGSFERLKWHIKFVLNHKSI
jgi:hypothetical protein